jgi:hypothetical protein
LQAAFARETQVEQHEIESVSAKHLVRRLAIVDPIHGETVPLEAGTDGLPDHGIIFD